MDRWTISRRFVASFLIAIVCLLVVAAFRVGDSKRVAEASAEQRELRVDQIAAANAVDDEVWIVDRGLNLALLDGDAALAADVAARAAALPEHLADELAVLAAGEPSQVALHDQLAGDLAELASVWASVAQRVADGQTATAVAEHRAATREVADRVMGATEELIVATTELQEADAVVAAAAGARSSNITVTIVLVVALGMLIASRYLARTISAPVGRAASDVDRWAVEIDGASEQVATAAEATASQANVLRLPASRCRATSRPWRRPWRRCRRPCVRWPRRPSKPPRSPVRPSARSR